MEPLKPDFEPITDKNLAYRHEFATIVGMNNTTQCTWKRATKDQASREWVGTVLLKMEVGVSNEQVRDLLWFVDNGAAALIEALDSVRFERARAEAAEAEVARLRATIAKAAPSSA